MLHILENTSFNEIDEICRSLKIKNYTINNDGKVDVDGGVYLSNMSLNKIPVEFGKVYGGFYIYGNNLISLQGAPSYVEGSFECYFNQLTSLEGGPQYVGLNFICANNLLTSLKGAPTHIGGRFNCLFSNLPDKIKKYKKYIREIIKSQDDYGIWNSDNTLNIYRFNSMMKEIKGEA